MNILIPDSWLREYLKTNATPKDIQKYLSLCGPSIERLHKINNDFIYDIEVTTNRVDCMSVYGIAREAYAILKYHGFNVNLNNLPQASLTLGDIPGLSITNDPKLCHRVLALKISNLKVEPSPKWLQEKLLAVGQRPLNNLVDITNYVMWETGHPTHVFDFDRLATGKMIFREAKPGEHVVSLEDKTYTMRGGEVVIDNGQGEIIDLPSIIGTTNSVVVPQTTNALFFVDDVKSSKVRFASMSHAIRTQAATLLEKDINPQTSAIAISCIVPLIKSLYPQAIISSLLDIFPNPPKPKSITVDLSQITNLIGINIDVKTITDILHNLSFQVNRNKNSISVTPPDFRYNDITIPQDLAEEIARIYGYPKIPPVLMAGNLPDNIINPQFYWENRIKTTLKYLGFSEVYTYSLVSSDVGLKLKNPLSSEWEFLRTSLYPSHKAIIDQNLGKVDFLDFFEISNVYIPQNHNLPKEELRLIVSSTKSDYYLFKGQLEALLNDIGIIDFPVEIQSDSYMLYWEIPLSNLLNHTSDIKTYTQISKFSPIIEDFNVPYKPPYSRIKENILKLSPLIKQIALIDKYEDKLTLRITFHSDDHQLSSNDISPIRDKIANVFSLHQT